MNKQLLFHILLLLSIPISKATSALKDESHTYFSVRPQFQFGSPELITTMRNSVRHSDEESNWFFSAVPFVGRSTNRNDIGTFLTPGETNQVTIGGTIGSNNTDILSQHFNIFSLTFSEFTNGMLDDINSILGGQAFNSTIEFRPKQKTCGIGFMGQYQFCIYNKIHIVKISAPITHVSNTAGFSEKINQKGAFYDVPVITDEITNLNTPQKSVTDAFAQDAWSFGKITKEDQKKTRLAFIQVQIAERSVETDCYHIDPFIGITIPTGNTPKAEFVFEPIVGHGAHPGIFWGFSGGHDLWKNNCETFFLSLETEQVFHYLFKKTQKRSFDLKQKEWSRYIEVYESQDQVQQALDLRGDAPLSSIFLASPGINVLTLDAKVTPGFNFTSNIALFLQYTKNSCAIDFELGYNLYAKQREKLALKNTFATEAAIKDHVGMGVTNPIRNMSTDLLTNDASFALLVDNGMLDTDTVIAEYKKNQIKETDLDLSSAAHPCFVAHTVYGNLSYQWNNCYMPLDLGLGGSYEFNGNSNALLERWLLWAQFGVQF